MNASSLLQSQGWRGAGHTLHASDDSTGLFRPLFVSRKDNTFGIGRKQHAANDQWWLNAFDQQLKGLDTSKKGEVVQTVTQGKLNAIVSSSGKYKGAAGLYASFVKGGTLESTLTPDEGDSTDATGTKDTEIAESGETKTERRARREARRLRKADKAARKAAESQPKAKLEKRTKKTASSAKRRKLENSEMQGG